MGRGYHYLLGLVRHGEHARLYRYVQDLRLIFCSYRLVPALAFEFAQLVIHIEGAGRLCGGLKRGQLPRGRHLANRAVICDRLVHGIQSQSIVARILRS